MKTDQDKEKAGSEFPSNERGKSKSNAMSIPTIELPKGGGAIKGIDEKFSLNPTNGTASFTIPIILTLSSSGKTWKKEYQYQVEQ